MIVLPSLLLRSAIAVLLAVAARAQYVWPAGLASSTGNAVMNAPFTSLPGHPTSTTRFMVVINQSSLPFSIGTALNRLSLRRDVRYPSQGYGSFTGTLNVKIGHAVNVPDQVHDVRFGRLWEGVPTTVYNGSFVVPAGGAPGASVPPFSIVIPFLRTFTWQGGPLAIEFLWTPTSGSSTWRIDAFAVPRINGTSRLTGPGCTGSNGFTPLQFVLPETTMPGETLTVQMERSKLPPTAGALENLAFHVMGFQNTTYQGNALPRSLAGVGGPAACFLRTDVVLTYPIVVSNPSALFARATSRVALPAHPSLVGALLYSQWLLLDTGVAASLPITVSDALAITLGQIAPTPVPHAARTIWKYGSSGQGSDSGRMVLDDYGPVLRFN